MPTPPPLQPWRRLQTRVAYVNEWLRIELDEVELPDGRAYEYTVLRRERQGVAIFALDEQQRVLLQQEYRYPVRSVIWQLPGGLMERHEDPEQAARRELAEETGYVAARWRRLGVILDDPAFQDMEITIFLAEAVRRTGETNPDPAEWVHNSWHSLDWVRRQVRTGRIRERVLLSALGFLWAEGIA